MRGGRGGRGGVLSRGIWREVEVREVLYNIFNELLMYIL